MTRRVTITLDDDVAEKLEAETRRRGTSVDAAVNEAVRKIVDDTPASPESLDSSTIVAITGPFARSRPGVGSFDCVARVLDEVEGPEWK